MKNFLFVLALFLSAPLFSQREKAANVPPEVRVALTKNFSTAKNISWEKEKNGNFEAEFMDGKTEVSAIFNTAGSLVETEREMTVAQLPATVREYVSKNYPGYKIKEASNITQADGLIKFEAELKKPFKKTVELLFDSSGNPVTK